MRGDVPTYLTFVNIANDFTLMQPFGGEVTRGFNRSPEWARGIAEYFKDGEADVELVQSYASGDKPGDIAVLVTIEHQHGKVGGLPDQQWPLRVTLVFRHGEADWELVHRHADLTVNASRSNRPQRRRAGTPMPRASRLRWNPRARRRTRKGCGGPPRSARVGSPYGSTSRRCRCSKCGLPRDRSFAGYR